MSEVWHRIQGLCRARGGWLVCWFAAFTFLAVIEAVQMYAGQRLEEVEIPLLTAIRRAAEHTYTSALLGLGILWFAQRFGFERARPFRWLLLHLGLSLVYTVVYSVALSALLHGQISVKGKMFQFGETMQKLLMFYTMSQVGTYWIILLGHHGWHFYQQYREREKQATALANELVEARLQALRMQLNPHFLFNTLNTISALVHDNPEAADRTVVRLSELLRRTLDGGSVEEVPLREEIAFLKSYVEIEQTRFQDRLRVDFELAPETLHLRVPFLILQPLVENAIRHGIEPKEEPGRVVVSARLAEPDLLELIVRDDGAGLRNGGQPVRDGVGLSNVRSRLLHSYGARQSLEVRNAADGGVECRLRLPRVQESTARPCRVVVVSARCDEPPGDATGPLAVCPPAS